jgi:DNA-binding NarL/FixJ family response regulator
MGNRITVLLVDDHRLVRLGFRRLLEDDGDLLVIGEATDGAEAIAQATALRPQVIVMDCAMPGASGLHATREILKRDAGVAILMLSMHAEDTLVRQALEAGARGYVLKSALDLDLAAAVKRVAAGEIVLDPQLSHPPAMRAGGNRGLSARELEVLQLICDGRSNREIAAMLGISANTISVHRTNIMNALDIHKTADLVVYALRHGLVTLP